jgi:hypothetical protein
MPGARFVPCVGVCRSFLNPRLRRDIIDTGVTLRFPINEETGSLEICFRGEVARDICVQLFTSKYCLWTIEFRPSLMF